MDRFEGARVQIEGEISCTYGPLLKDPFSLSLLFLSRDYIAFKDPFPLKDTR